MTFIGDQNVGKTSIISRFVQDAFQPNANVFIYKSIYLSQQKEQISCLKHYKFKVKQSGYNYGIQQVNKDLDY